MNQLLRYTNGGGHLIFSCVLVVCMTILLALGKIDTEAFYIISGPVVLFWFGTGIGNRIAEAKVEVPPVQLQEPKP